MSIFRQSTLGTANNQITFNQLGAYPYYRMTSKTLTRRELVEYDIKIPETMGVADFQTLEGKAYLLLSGTMYPKDEPTYDSGKRALRKLASLPIEQADASSDSGYVPYTYTESDGIAKTINVKVLYVDLPENSRNGLKQPFRLFTKIKYPVILGPQTSITIGSSTASTSGSSNLPFALPLAIGLTTYSSTGAFTNIGDTPTYPAMVIYGPITTPRITNATTGQFIEVGVSLPTSSDSLAISYDSDSRDISVAGNTVESKLTSASTLFKLNSGITQLTLSGATVGTGAYASLAASPAWALS
jgi:hypothetical protein